MSNNTNVSVHPQIKNIIRNLDLDLGVELNRYEQSLKHDYALIAQSSTYDSSFSSYASEQYVSYQSATIEEQEDVIPVASRLIEEPNSWVEKILSPWGIFGIIFFFAANLFMFLNWDNITTVENSVNNNQTNVETNSDPDKTNNSSISTTEKLPNTNNSSNSVATANSENTSPYPDLKTALFREINQPQATTNNVEQFNQGNPSVQSTQNNTNSPVTTNNVNPSGKNYYLLSNYANMAEFTRIKNILPSAAIVNIGQQTKIQLAVLNNENEAKAQSQKLKTQGIDNYIYSP